MTRITNTGEIKYGDIILGLPRKDANTGAFLRNDYNKGNALLNWEDHCIDIDISIDDVGSFSKECYIAKCIMIDSGLYFVDLKTNDTFYWDKDVDTICVPYTIWKLDIKI